MNQKLLVVGNWKMELSHKASLEVAKSLKKLLRDVKLGGEVVLCPSYPTLPAVAEIFSQAKEKVSVGAQNIYHEERGAYTGQVSVLQIKPWATWCIVGHSESRSVSGESDEQVLQKVNILLRHGLRPIICIGENAEERAADQTVNKVTNQMEVLLSGLDRSSLSKVVICYEPIWAISSVRTSPMPDPQEISQTAMLIRKVVANKFDREIVERLRLLYGGSVNAQNVAQYVGEPGIDGVLVGSAATHPRDFLEIIVNARRAWSP